MEEAAPRADIFVTATGNADVITVDHMRAMKNMAIVCNIGHFDSEIQIAGLNNMKWTEIKPQVDEVEFADGKKIIVLAKGRLVNLGCATGHPSFVMSSSFTNQVLAQIELWTKADDYKNEVYVLPKQTHCCSLEVLRLRRVGSHNGDFPFSRAPLVDHVTVQVVRVLDTSHVIKGDIDVTSGNSEQFVSYPATGDAHSGAQLVMAHNRAKQPEKLALARV